MLRPVLITFFYKVKRKQMQSVLGKVNIAVRKHKTGGTVLTARDFKTSSNAIDQLIKFDDRYRILKEIRGSPPYWEKARKDLYAMIRQLGPAQLFLTPVSYTHLTLPTILRV